VLLASRTPIEEKQGRKNMVEEENMDMEDEVEPELGKAEMEMLNDIIWKDLKVLSNIHIRYQKLLRELGMGGNAVGGIFEENYLSYTGIMSSCAVILHKILNFFKS